MTGLLGARMLHGRRTADYPASDPVLPERFRGRPAVDPAKCSDGCRECAQACPTSAILLDPLRIDLGACLFCPVCEEACPEGAISYRPDHRLAARRREDLVVGGPGRDAREASLVTALDAKMRSLFGRSLKLRQVAAGGCNGCEAELAALSNVVFDLSRFGIQFVASPRHADGIAITGPVTTNMAAALRDTYAAVPAPKIVVAIGACAVSGGPFAGADACGRGVPAEVPVDLWVPGCPPHPFTVLDGLLRLLGRIENAGADRARPSVRPDV